MKKDLLRKNIIRAVAFFCVIVIIEALFNIFAPSENSKPFWVSLLMYIPKAIMLTVIYLLVFNLFDEFEKRRKKNSGNDNKEE